MADLKDRRAKRPSLPEELSKLVQLPMHPEIHKELKIIALREDFDTAGEWLHHHLCHVLSREDLLLRAPDTASAR